MIYSTLKRLGLEVAIRQTLYYDQNDDEEINLETEDEVEDMAIKLSKNKVTRIMENFNSPFQVTHAWKNDEDQWPPKVREVGKNILIVSNRWTDRG